MCKFYQEKEFIDGFKKLIKECDKKILEIYATDFSIEYKDDKSPLTIADKLSNQIICDYLYKINFDLEKILNQKILIISEENKNINYDERKKYNYCWIIDPIDGTKEFIKKNGEFTINIGLIFNNTPIFGIVSIPVLDEIYYGIEGIGSFKEVNNLVKKLQINNNKMNDDIINIVASKSHLNNETQQFINQYKNYELISIGSSIKFLYIVENKAHIYPRIAPTSEWDTCAAHAVVKYAYGLVLDYNTKKEIVYNKENLLNPSFIVY